VHPANNQKKEEDMKTTSDMPLGILAAIKAEALHQVKSADRDEILFAQRRVLDLIRKTLPAVDRELIEELRKNPRNSFQVIADQNGESPSVTFKSSKWKRVDEPRTAAGVFTIAEAARELHTHTGIIRDRVRKDPNATWFTRTVRPELKRQTILIVDLPALERLLPAGERGRHSITEAAGELRVQRSIVNDCVNRNIDKPWVVRELIPGKKRADFWVTDVSALKKALEGEPRGFTPTQAAKETGIVLSEIQGFIRQHSDSSNLERTRVQPAGRPRIRIIDTDVLRREMAAG
jgi:hypothetical protein